MYIARRWLLSLMFFLALLLVVAACTFPGQQDQPLFTNQVAPISARVIIAGTSPDGVLPTGFLGFSYEASLLPNETAFQTTQGNLLALYRLLGRENIRIGGNSVDRETFWEPGFLPVPAWATSIIKPADLTRLAHFTRAAGWKVELAVNLGHIDRNDINSEAHYASSTLGSSLKALECGNEPNDYRNRLRPANYGYSAYQTDFLACAEAIGQKVPIAGPDTSGDFITDIAHNEADRLAMLTQHVYIFDKCSGQLATTTAFLSARSDQLAIGKVSPTLKSARAVHLPLRIDETNSVDCGGQSGISDVYASTLWGLNYILLMAQQGVAGVNFHGSLGLCSGVNGLAGGYTPLCATSLANLQDDLFTPQPLYYGMLFAHLMGSGVFYPVTVSTSCNLTAYAVHGTDGKTRVMLIEKDGTFNPPVEVKLDYGSGNRTAQVLHLSGSSLTSNKGINIQGATISQQRGFTLPTADQLQGENGTYTVRVAAGSAVLITFPS